MVAENARDALGRAAACAAAGRSAPLTDPEIAHLAGLVTADPDPRVRAAALGAVLRVEPGSERTVTAWTAAINDPDPAVRRRAAEVAPPLDNPATAAPLLITAVQHDVPEVAEVAAWALGELPASAAGPAAVDALATATTSHRDPLVREASVAALGALGDRAGLPAILAACSDKPAIRRRAVLALAPFDGPDVEAAIARAGADRDWQVRQAAEDLRGA
jgi:HEAT repeat protein